MSKEKIIKIGSNYIVKKIGRHIYTERGLVVEDIIKQLKYGNELPVERILINQKTSGTNSIQKIEKYF